MINLEYLYLDESEPSSKVIFQDKNSQILGIKFRKNDLKFFEKYEFVRNSCVYFLLNDESIYIGKSVNGIERIKEHVRKKEFWEFGLMFVSDNKSWTSTTIDYLEYHFINVFNKLGDLSLENDDKRTIKPNITIYDEATFESIIKKVSFYLNCNNITTSFNKVENETYKSYYNNEKTATLIYDGTRYILCKGSKLKQPLKTTNEYDQGLMLCQVFSPKIIELRYKF